MQPVTREEDEWPPDRAAQLKKVSSAIRRALPKGYEEAISGSLITYHVHAGREMGGNRAFRSKAEAEVCSTPVQGVVTRVQRVL